MSRQLKFRAWDRNLGKFVHIYEIGEIPERGVFGLSKTILVNESMIDYDINNIIIQQFTGLKDVNGKEIYEGDIVKFSIHGATHGREREDDCGGEVWYDEELAMFCFGKFHVEEYKHPWGTHIIPAHNWGYSMNDEIDLNTFEVTGNIFDNK